MHARHVAIRIKSGEVPRARDIFNEGALPALAAQPGFRGACLLADEASGEGAIVILWERAEDSQRLEAAGFYKEQIARFAQVFAAPPQPALMQVQVWSIGETP
ncbi:MAG: hypothetical protein V4864_13025 [Pseudomonadota bacterium]